MSAAQLQQYPSAAHSAAPRGILSRMSSTSASASRPGSAGLTIPTTPSVTDQGLFSNNPNVVSPLNMHSRTLSFTDSHHGSPMNAAKMATIHHLTGENHDIVYPVTSDDYDIVQEIGVGAFATVYRAYVTCTGEEVAIKIIDLEQFNTNWDEIRREIQIMSMLHHPNVVKIKTSFIVNSDLWIVMPLLEAGSCAALMKQLAPSGFKDEVLIATILKETLQGLMYFHKDGRIHRDLKAGNILIGKHGEVQLADFGVAGTLMENGDRKRNRQTFTGTPCWMAPEVMEHTSGYDEKADIWSFGITAMELGFGRAPYARFQPMKVMLMTISEEPPTCDIYKDNSYQFSKNFHSLIAKCLRRDPKKRLNAKKLMEHKFFKQARDRNYIIEKLVSKVPPRPAAGTTARVHVCREKTLIDQAKIEKSKPVSVGSWSFDREELAEMKARAIEEKSKSARDREQAVESSYHHHSSDSDPSEEANHDDANVELQVEDVAGNVLDASALRHLSHRRNSGAGNALYLQTTDPRDLHTVGAPGSHRSNEIDNSELLVKRNEEDSRPIPSFSPLQPGMHRSESNQQGRFMVCDEDDGSTPLQQSMEGQGHVDELDISSVQLQDQMDPNQQHRFRIDSDAQNCYAPDTYAQDQDAYPQDDQDGQHVGRFSIRDEE